MMFVSESWGELLELLKERSVLRGSFLLQSGRESSFYVNCKETLLDPRGMSLTGLVLSSMLHQESHPVDAVAGVSVGGDPMVCALVLTALSQGKLLPGILVRKEHKDHGTCRSHLEGAGQVRTGAQVLLLEDVITTGESTVRAVRALRGHHFQVPLVYALVDRGESQGKEAIEAEGCMVRSVFSRADLEKDTA